MTILWMERALLENEIRIASLSPAIAVESTHLEEFHKDPADQMIVATARVAGWPVVSADHRIRGYPGVETVW